MYRVKEACVFGVKKKKKEGEWATDSMMAYLLKLALHEGLALVTVTVVIGEVPLHAPPHEAKFLPAGGIAVRVTTVPAKNLVEQTLTPPEPPQSMD
jgi:hypothetical protein